MMNGAHALIRTLVDAGVDTCFMNPGTSEMHFVAALDDVPEMHSVLALFEGVATGAADGYARMSGKPAAVLLHLGPGLGNGLANLHNARRGRVPVVNIIGDHATYHQKYDAPLQSDIDSIAKGVSGWIRMSTDPEQVAGDAAAAVAAAYGRPGQVATLILPADVCWLDSPGPVPPLPVPTRREIATSSLETVAALLRGEGATAIMLGGSSLMEEGLVAASRVANASGAKLLAETFPTRLQRGEGIPAVERLGYLAEFAQAQLAGIDNLILVEASSPVSFFAYPDKASDLVPEGCQVHVLAAPGDDSISGLEALAELLGAAADSATLACAFRPERPTGALNAETFASAVGALLPEDVIVVDEGNTAGLFVSGFTAGAPRHDWLCLPGGAIGFGMPVATGAAVASPGRRVLNLQADGSAMYTMQSLWTQARENLDVTTVILNNQSYAILNLELTRVGANPGPKALEMLDLTGPSLDFVSLATGMGVKATRATTAEEFTEQLETALNTPGPNLVEAILPPTL
ncbi:MAG: acetolactate synthase large subunit [Microthrixaceae bacterium]